VCFITAGPITKLCAWGGEEALTHSIGYDTPPGICTSSKKDPTLTVPTLFDRLLIRDGTTGSYPLSPTQSMASAAKGAKGAKGGGSGGGGVGGGGGSMTSLDNIGAPPGVAVKKGLSRVLCPASCAVVSCPASCAAVCEVVCGLRGGLRSYSVVRSAVCGVCSAVVFGRVRSCVLRSCSVVRSVVRVVLCSVLTL
jgi:hypothetical protein